MLPCGAAEWRGICIHASCLLTVRPQLPLSLQAMCQHIRCRRVSKRTSKEPAELYNIHGFAVLCDSNHDA